MPYWKVGRKLEAHFQWAHARDLEPEKDELPKILDKLEHGLAEAKAPVYAEATPPSKTDATPVAAIDAKSNAEESVTVERGDSLWDIARKIYGNADLYELDLLGQPGQDREPEQDLPGHDADDSGAGNQLDRSNSVVRP